MAKLSRIVPAILTDDSTALETMVRQVESFTTYVQFDIMDSHFVPSRSITCEHLAALPMKLSWEAHLMAERPEDYLEGFRQAGAQKVIFHYEATPSPREVISRAKGLGLEVGLAVNPETQIFTILPLLDAVDSVLLLTVHPGFYGSQFLPEVLEKVPELCCAQPKMEIGVDGGIKESNATQVAQAGVDVIYVGSAIFLQPQPGESFNRLSVLAQEGSRHRRL
ncbi:ribulose-phosphate 3-epimerase [Chloroflexota bacterium]